MSHIPSRRQAKPDELFTIRFTDILHLFNLQDPSPEAYGLIAQLVRARA